MVVCHPSVVADTGIAGKQADNVRVFFIPVAAAWVWVAGRFSRTQCQWRQFAPMRNHSHIPYEIDDDGFACDFDSSEARTDHHQLCKANIIYSLYMKSHVNHSDIFAAWLFNTNCHCRWYDIGISLIYYLDSREIVRLVFIGWMSLKCRLNDDVGEQQCTTTHQLFLGNQLKLFYCMIVFQTKTQ